jgi:hypothetical protein
LTKLKIYGIIIIEKRKSQLPKISKKILKKVLTKPKKYAIIVIQGKGKTSRPKEKNLKKVKKKS